MIIDLTRTMEAIPADNEERGWNSFQAFRDDGFRVTDSEYWDAWRDWKEFRDARVSKLYSKEDSVRVAGAALLNEHMRVVLKRCSSNEIRPEVVKIIEGLGNPPMNQLAIDEAAARIVELDIQYRKRREADHD